MIGVTRAAYASVEEKVYSFRVALSVYIGLVRASLQDKFPVLSKHAFLALVAAVGVVVFVQTLILAITFITKTLSFVWMLPSVIGGLFAYVPLFNKWV